MDKLFLSVCILNSQRSGGIDTAGDSLECGAAAFCGDQFAGQVVQRTPCLYERIGVCTLDTGVIGLVDCLNAKESELVERKLLSTHRTQTGGDLREIIRIVLGLAIDIQPEAKEQGIETPLGYPGTCM